MFNCSCQNIVHDLFAKVHRNTVYYAYNISYLAHWQTEIRVTAHTDNTEKTRIKCAVQGHNGRHKELQQYARQERDLMDSPRALMKCPVTFICGQSQFVSF